MSSMVIQIWFIMVAAAENYMIMAVAMITMRMTIKMTIMMEDGPLCKF